MPFADVYEKRNKNTREVTLPGYLCYYILVVESTSVSTASIKDGHADSLHKLLHLHISFSVSCGVFFISLSIDLAAQRALPRDR